ncbi:MAG: hypothetical protein VX420_02980, partial [SAR324 cluster bacterium]|nr:hypothetical protein [SAR324 cluster bacterium]
DYDTLPLEHFEPMVRNVLNKPRNPDKERMARISHRYFELGLNINRVGGPLAVWRIAPPLTITKSEVDQALEIMDEAFASK